MPVATRPARPRRCSASALVTRSVTKRDMPDDGSNRARRALPPSTTMRMSGSVSEVSAIEVARTTRRPSTGPRAARWAANSIAPKRGRTVQSETRPARAVATLRISPSPGRKARRPPSGTSSKAWRICAAMTASKRAVGSGLRGSQRVSTAKARPCEVTRGASCIRRATGSASRVADMTITTRSSRSAPRSSKVSARPKSACRLRSWNSSKITAPTPGRSGSDWIMRVRMPSVTTSMRVARVTLASPLMR